MDQQSEQAKQLLDGIVDTAEQAKVALVTSHAGTLMVLGIEYEDAIKQLESYLEPKDLQRFIEYRTFIWTGNFNGEMWIHKKAIRAGWIIDVVEVTDEQWRAHVLDQVNRATQAAMQRVQPQG